MRICFLGDAASIHVQRWCEYFRDKKHQVYIITFRPAVIEGVNVICVGDNIEVNSSGGNSKYLKKIFKIKKIIKEINPDIVNAHYLTSYGLIGVLLGRRPVVVSTWGTDILVTPKVNKVYKKLTEFVIKKSDLLTSDSKFMSEEILNLGGKKEKIKTVPMGVSKGLFHSQHRKVNNTKIFLSMRTLCENSNIDCILKAFSRVVREVPSSKLIITNSGDYLESIKKLIIELELDNNVEYLGFVNRQRVSELLYESDVYLSIPTSDSTSVNLLEGMAAGIFPIVSDLPANNEWINHEENGLVLKSINEEELSKLMLKAIHNNNMREASIEINRKIINERAIWEDNMADIEILYKSLIKVGKSIE